MNMIVSRDEFQKAMMLKSCPREAGDTQPYITPKRQTYSKNLMQDLSK
jgi:hypothetical protein